MLLSFASQDELLQAFQISMAWGALVVVVTTVLMTMSLEGTKSEISRSTGFILGCLFYLLFGSLTFKEQYGSFSAAEIGAQHVELRYASGLFQPVRLEAGQIESIEVGHPGKGEPAQCYLNLTLRSGESYRSAPATDKDCEGYRKQLEGLLR